MEWLKKIVDFAGLYQRAINIVVAALVREYLLDYIKAINKEKITVEFLKKVKSIIIYIERRINKQ